MINVKHKRTVMFLVLILIISINFIVANSTRNESLDLNEEEVQSKAENTDNNIEFKNGIKINNEENIEQEELEINVKLTAVGDIMFHKYQLRRAYDSQNNTFDFNQGFKFVKDYLKSADYTVGNLETTLAGKDGARRFNVDTWIHGYSGFPCFNTPDSVLDTLNNSGFDMLLTANNHTLDSKNEGLYRTIDTLDRYGIDHVGTYETEEASQKPFLKDINGMEFAFLGVTYGINGFETGEENEHIIDTLDIYNAEKVEKFCAKIEKAEALNPDFTVVMVHFGNEYFNEPNTYQRDFVDKLFNAGADVILGSHPHVLQPIEIREIQSEDGIKKHGVVIYSLGNFISSQMGKNGVDKDLGVMMTIDFSKIGNQTAIKGITLVPTYTYWTKDVIGILPVNETLERIDNGEFTLPKYDIKRLNYGKNHAVEHLTSYVKDYNLSYDSVEHTYYIKLQ